VATGETRDGGRERERELIPEGDSFFFQRALCTWKREKNLPMSSSLERA